MVWYGSIYSVRTHTYVDSFTALQQFCWEQSKPICRFPLNFWVFRKPSPREYPTQKGQRRQKCAHLLTHSFLPTCLWGKVGWTSHVWQGCIDPWLRCFFSSCATQNALICRRPASMDHDKKNPGQYSQRIMNVFLTRWCGMRRRENRKARARETAMGELSNHSWKVSNNSDTSFFFLGGWLVGWLVNGWGHLRSTRSINLSFYPTTKKIASCAHRSVVIFTYG